MMSSSDQRQLAKYYKRQRALLRKHHLEQWSVTDHDDWMKTEHDISQLVLEGRRKALQSWRERMSSLREAASWARVRQTHTLKL